jgi:SAM-dependent methyltransferase
VVDSAANADQFDYWNGPDGEHWVAYELRFDAMLAPFVPHILDGAGIAADDRVLDVGCGNGATARAAAHRVSNGRVVGVDISAPMVRRAQERARSNGIGNVEFVHADAQTHAFNETFDAIVSRFGVMFFDDPVAAFTNLGRATSADGHLAFVCWQELFANEWVSVAGAALITHVGMPDFPPVGAPGPFAFADPDRVRNILTGTGFVDIGIDAIHEDVLIGGGLDVDATVEFIAEGGMGQRFLAGADPAAVEAGLDAVRQALAPYDSPDGVRMGSAAWLVTARRGSGGRG